MKNALINLIVLVVLVINTGAAVQAYQPLPGRPIGIAARVA